MAALISESNANIGVEGASAAEQVAQDTCRMVIALELSPCTSTLSFGSILPLLGRTQYCLGAVVFTLNATGCGLLFVTVRVRLTSCVSGPDWGEHHVHIMRRGRRTRTNAKERHRQNMLKCQTASAGLAPKRRLLTVESQLRIGFEFDRHVAMFSDLTSQPIDLPAVGPFASCGVGSATREGRSGLEKDGRS